MASTADPSESEPSAGAGALTLIDHFRRQVRLRADAPALHVRSGGRWAPITWGQFDVAARRITAYLIGEGLAEHDHVAIWSSNRPEWHIADIAILSGRMKPVPVYPSLSVEQGRYALDHADTRVCIVESEEILARVMAVRKRLPSLLRVVMLDGAPGARSVVPGDGLVILWQEALRRGQACIDAGGGAEAERRVASVTADDICSIIYTSGTTGPPKAVQITHRNVAVGTAGVTALVRADEHDRVLSYLPLAHIAERMVSEFHSYIFGNPTWFLDALPNLGAALCEVRPTLFFGVPRVWEKMAAQVRSGIDDAPLFRRMIARWAIGIGERAAVRDVAGAAVSPGLRRRRAVADRLVLAGLRARLGLDQARVLASGAAPIAPGLLTFFRAIGLEICEIYGMTENCGCGAMSPPGRSRPGSVGPAIPGTEIRIAEDGEILVRGGVVFSGYEKDAAATAAAIDAGGWLHTGDVGVIEADGFLRITDRKKDLIITSGGKNVAPGNLEALLCEHALVGTAVAIGDRRPYMTALLVLDPDAVGRFAKQRGIGGGLAEMAGAPDVIDALREHVAWVNARLSHAEQVKRFAVLPNVFTLGEELTPTLKVRRAVVAEKYAGEIEGMYARPKD